MMRCWGSTVIWRLLAVLWMGGALVGCAGSADVAPPDTSPSELTVKQATVAEPYASVRVFFGTNRARTPAQDAIRFGTKRGDLVLGSCTVSIPPHHRVGEIERPSIWRLEFREDPARHVTLLSLGLLSEQDFVHRVMARARTSRKEALVFVHGYNVSFEEAARRAGQLKYDLSFPGPVLFFSWPSRGIPVGYAHDEDNIEWSVPDLISFLHLLTGRSDLERVYFVAHSMGSRGAVRALSELKEVHGLAERQKISELILAAPDIDADVFVEQLLPRLAAPRTRITIYASTQDNALSISRFFNGNERLGARVLDLENVDFVDVSGAVGHSYFADSGRVIEDLYRLLMEGLSASERSLEAVRLSARKMYYRLRAP